MNEHAICHIPDSAYCFPLDQKHITLRLRCAKGDLTEAWVVYESKYVIAQRQCRKQMEKKFQGKLYDYYSVTLELQDTRIGYVFYIRAGEEYYYFSEDGVTKTYDYSLGYYNFFQYPYIHEADTMQKVDWTDHAVFYQIFVDRFCRGNEKADKSYVNCRWGDIPDPKTFAGGDLQGILNRLDYIAGLGVNTIYLTPVFRSKSNHKYDISDYMQVDAQFGTNEDLHRLVYRAHEMGIRIVLDAVFNHCSEELAQFQDVLHKGKASPYYDWFVIYGDKPVPKQGNYEMFAACNYMPKFNTSNPEVQRYLCDIGCYYVQQYGIDGWRLDVSDEVSHDLWRAFRKAVKGCSAECIIIGENWHDASNYLRGDQYDSIMNYAFTKACLDYFAAGAMDAEQTAQKLNDILARNTDTVNSMMLNLLDSHDTHRFFSEVGCDREKMSAALCLLFLFPGIPCIFYGTEFFMEGGYDPDCRRCMDWKGYEMGSYEESVKLIRELADLRKTYHLSEAPAQIIAKGNVLIVHRYTGAVKLSLYINLSGQGQTADGRDIGAHSHVLITEAD